VVTEVSGGDPGYSETSKMISEAALCLANDDLTPTPARSPGLGDGTGTAFPTAGGGVDFELLSST